MSVLTPVAALGETLSADTFVFSAEPDSRLPLNPDTATQRYKRMATRLGIDTTLEEPKHYTATELISGGVDVRTVAGRLGHGGGGATTLRVYAAWTSEADQRAARTSAAECQHDRKVSLRPARTRQQRQLSGGRLAVSEDRE